MSNCSLPTTPPAPGTAATRGPIAILGSSRSNGKTFEALKAVIGDRHIPLVDLRSLNISCFDYEHANLKDDYLPLMEWAVHHSPIILATPIYWYTMSATMKIFLDRMSDLLDVRKDLGKALIGKTLAIVASHAGEEHPAAFEEPFRNTCNYMKMTYAGCFYWYSGSNPTKAAGNAAAAKAFGDRVLGGGQKAS